MPSNKNRIEQNESPVNKLTRVAAYTRVSTDEQASKGTSLPSQSERIAALCIARGWLQVAEFVDPGVSGTLARRPGLDALIEAAQAGRFDVVVVFAIDRLARKQSLVLSLIDRLRDFDVGFASVSESFDTSSPSGQAMLGMLSTFAQFEHSTIADRMKRGKQRRAEAGIWAQGKTPFGYAYDLNTKAVTIDVSEAKVVRRIFSLYTGSTKGGKAIASILNRDGVAPRGEARAWYGTAVFEVLRNSAYRGQGTLGVAVPPLVSEGVWKEAERRRGTNRHIRTTKQEWLLQARVKCAEHNYLLAARYSHGRRFYECPGRLRSTAIVGDLCTLQRFKAGELEAAVIDHLANVLRDPKKAKEVAKVALGWLRKERDALLEAVQPPAERMERVIAALERLGDDYVEGLLPKEKLISRRDDLEREKALLEAQVHAIDPGRLNEIELLEQAIEIEQWWPQGPFHLGDPEWMGDREADWRAAQAPLSWPPAWSTDMSGIAWDHSYGVLIPGNLPPALEASAEAIKNETWDMGLTLHGNTPEHNRHIRWITWQEVMDRTHVELVATNEKLVVNGLFDLGEILLGTEQGDSSGCTGLLLRRDPATVSRLPPDSRSAPGTRAARRRTPPGHERDTGRTGCR